MCKTLFFDGVGFRKLSDFFADKVCRSSSANNLT